MNPVLKHLIETGIPVSKAQFHAAVNNADNVPENYFSTESLNKSRQADMWWTPHTLVCHQKGKYFGVPISTVIFANFICDDMKEESNIALDPAGPKKRGRPFKTE